MANFSLAAILNIFAILNCLDTLQTIFDLFWSRLQKYIMKSVLTIIAHGMTIQTPLLFFFTLFLIFSPFFFSRSLTLALTLGALKLEGPGGKNPTSLYGQSAAGHKQH
jgi:hypothetical protein